MNILIGETVSYVLQNIMRKEDAVERLKLRKLIIRFVLTQKRHCVI